MVLPDGGVQIHTRCAARNAAAFVLAAVDQPDVAAAQIYNCGDPTSWSMRVWAESIVELMGSEMAMISIPSEIAIEAATTLQPLGNTTATHCIVSIEKAQRELGWQPVVQPIDALEELLDWYGSQPAFDASASPSFTDRFDYATEDALIAAYERAVGTITDTVEQHEAPPVHSMPHPTASRRGRPSGSLSHRGRRSRRVSVCPCRGQKSRDCRSRTTSWVRDSRGS